MAGHSKWANIKRTKEAVDAKRSKAFSKLSKDLSTAARLGETGDLNFNPMLKAVVDKAKAANMPNEKIQHAIDKALGLTGSDEVLYENTYEFYGPNGTAFLVDCETDNPNRTVSEIKVIANKNGLKMANEGSLSWQFEEVGIVSLDLKSGEDKDVVALGLLDINGIRDLKLNSKEGKIKVIVNKEDLKSVVDKIKESLDSVHLENAEIIKKTDTMVSPEGIEPKLKQIEEAFEEDLDVVNIWTNYKINE